MTRSALSTAAFAQLIQRLCQANARYSEIALEFRQLVRRTYHAQRRAHRTGLRIDIAKAQACPNEYVSARPLPVLDLSSDDDLASDEDAPASASDSAETAFGGDGCDDHVHRWDGGSAHDDVPEHVAQCKDYRGQKDRPQFTFRLPLLQLLLNLHYSTGASSSSFERPVRGAPSMLPRQLSEDACGTEERVLGSVSTSADEPVVNSGRHSGLRIAVPPRGLKRKMRDVEADDYPERFRQAERMFKARWDDSRRR